LVTALAREGHNPCEIGRRTGIPVSTVRYWLHDGYGRRPRRRHFEPGELPRERYAYLLGAYLGDGHIARLPRTYRLGITLDARYPGIVDEVRQAMAAVLAPNPATIRRVRHTAAVEVTAHSRLLPQMFPQHGPGPKHRRPIVLADWQQEIVEEHSERFLRGLIQSDGCRCLNRVWSGKYAYPRYFFTQESVDIMDLFTDACDRLGIDYAFTKRNTVSVARRASVARLDAFVGPKA
jgi:hypothetical protein